MFDIDIWDYIDEAFLLNLSKGLLFLVIALPVAFYLRKAIRVSVTGKYGPHYGMLTAKIAYYIMMVIILIVVLTEVGFSLAPLLGAAGIVGVALGFASQTSVSNVISGLFLIAEKPFEIGDIITVGDQTGIILSIDTLSVKMRTFDNRFVRIPNEMILKQVVTNITRFPIRRVDIAVGYAYKEDMERVRAVLLDIAEKNPRALQEPAPMVFFDKFGSSSIDVSFRVWTVKDDFLQTRDELSIAVKKRFDEEGIEIPFPHLSLYTGEATRAFPISNHSAVPDSKSSESPSDGPSEVPTT
jgi:small-conductance mechanosensitive channel